MNLFFVLTNLVSHLTILTLSTVQLVFILVVPTIVLIVVFFLIYIPARRKSNKKNYQEYTYRQLYKIAMNQDYYLINNFMFRVDSTVMKIDHLLFADKFIYVISDACFEGDIAGKQDDNSIILVPKNAPKRYEDNPVILNKKMLTKLSMLTGIDASLMIGLVAINDDCNSGVESKSKQFYFIQVNKLKAMIKAIESRNVGKINTEQLANAVLAIDKMNRKKRQNGKK